MHTLFRLESRAVVSFKSMSSKLLTVCGGTIGALLIGGSALVMHETSGVVEALSRDYTLALAGKAASEVVSDLSSAGAAARTMAEAIASYHQSGGRDRLTVLEMLKPNLKSSKVVFGSWVFTAPNAWDGLDSLEMGKTARGANSSGHFMPYFAQPGGKVVLEPAEDQNVYNEEFYTASAASRDAAITEPYSYTVSGRTVLLTSVTYPVISGGKLIGVAGLDLELGGLAADLAKIRPFGDGRVTLLSKTGKWVVSSNPGLLTKSYGDAGSEVVQSALKTGAPAFVPGIVVDGINVERLVYPVSINGLNAKWAVVVDVPSATINASSKRLAIMLLVGGILILLAVLASLYAATRAIVQLKFSAMHDELTTLPNRTLFERTARRSIASGASQFALLFIDVDNFKTINDARGHVFGDTVLQKIAARLARVTPKGGLLARLAGDEFVMKVDGAKDEDIKEIATQLASDLKETMSRVLEVDGTSVNASVSVGISSFPQDGTNLPDLLKNADAAMYQSKQQGRNTFSFYHPRLGAEAQERLKIETELRFAVGREQLELHLQPQLCLSSEWICGAEALLRWRHPELGNVSPAKFIPIAEESGLIIEIGQWVIEEACTHLKAWHNAGVMRLPMAINVSAIQLRQPEFIPDLLECVRKSGVDPQDLDLEITERVALTDSDLILSRLKDLKGAGFSLSMDDFGTGYSNLGYLQSFPLDKLKIDRSFVIGIESNANARAIVRAIIALGRSLNVELVAEGVETAGQAHLLRELGCHLGQGYLYSRPLPAAEFINFHNIHLLRAAKALSEAGWRRQEPPAAQISAELFPSVRTSA